MAPTIIIGYEQIINAMRTLHSRGELSDEQMKQAEARYQMLTGGRK